MAAEGIVDERVVEGPNKNQRMETQISMNGEDVERMDEKPEAPSRNKGRKLKGVKSGGRQTITARRENTIREYTSLMEEVLDKENMLRAYANVVRNKGAPGIDGMTTGDLKEYLKKHWIQLRSELLEGRYKPQAVKQVEIPKPDGGIRKLGIPTVIDRLIQQAIHQTLSPIYEKEFSESSYGFRPGRSAQQAVLKAREHIAKGKGWVVDLDLEKFFDRVNHDILMARIARKIKDRKLLKLIRSYLQAGIMIGGIETAREEGTPQGGPLSPLLSNILLDDLDKELERRGHAFCRYADDCNIYVLSETAGQRVMASIKEFLEQRLKLKVNEGKSKVARPSERKFLGYTFMRRNGTKVKIAEKAINRLKDKVREYLKHGKGKSLKKTIDELQPILRGWINYFKYTEVNTPLDRIDKWIRRKLRKIIWMQMKKPWTRAKMLMKRGVDKDNAWRTAKSRKGAWRNSKTEAMSKAFPNKYFTSMGHISLLQEKNRLMGS